MKYSQFRRWTEFYNVDNDLSGEEVLRILKDHFSVEYRDQTMESIREQFYNNITRLLAVDFRADTSAKSLLRYLSMKKLELFAQKIQQARDKEIMEDVIDEIMENRGISREEALKILDNPF